MSIVPLGSLDLDNCSYRVEDVMIQDLSSLREGHKFIIAEFFFHGIKNTQMSIPEMCYSLFVSPKSRRHGSHNNVLDHFESLRGNIGRIVGGGLLQVSDENQATLKDWSGQFFAEPHIVRQKMAILLAPVLQQKIGDDINVAEEQINTSFMNSYWLRYKQVFLQLTNYLQFLHGDEYLSYLQKSVEDYMQGERESFTARKPY